MNTDFLGMATPDPDAVRPLSVSSTDGKMISSAIAAVLSCAATHVVHPSQSGALKGRQLIDNVLDIDTAMVVCSMTEYKRAAAVFFDFRAAFPSLCVKYLFAALEAMNMPPMIVRAIKQLYQDNYHDILINGRVFPGFTVKSGVRQGCPLSGSLFVLALDPFMRMLHHVLQCPRLVIRGYFDDLAVGFFDILRQLQRCLEVFSLIESIAGLALNPRKVVVVPLHAECIAPITWKNDFHRLVPAAARFTIQYYAKYLGVMLGPSAPERRWEHAASMIIKEAQEIRKLGAGIQNSIALFNSRALSKLGFPAQFFIPDQVVRRGIHRSLQILHASPWHSIPDGLLINATEVGLTCQVRNPEAYMLACRYRAAFSTARSLLANLACLASLNDNEELLLRFVQHLDASPMYRNSIAISMDSSRNDVARHTAIKPEWRTGRFISQKLVTSDLCTAMHGMDIGVLLRKRLGRFMLNDVESQVAHLLRVNSILKSHLPPFICFDIWRTWLFAWNTAARYQTQETCLFCGQHEDSFKHIVFCKSLNYVPRVIFPRTPLDLGYPQFLLCNAPLEDTCTLVLQAVVVHLAIALHSSLRSCGRRHEGGQVDLIRARLKRILRDDIKGVSKRHVLSAM